MALPTNPTDTWMQGHDLPSRIFGHLAGSDHELYEQEGEFVLTIDLPGFDPEEIDVSWDEGVLNVAARHVAEDRSREKTYHRRFRFPKEIDEDAIEATYRNGVLEVTLPLSEDAVPRGRATPSRADGAARPIGVPSNERSFSSAREPSRRDQNGERVSIARGDNCPRGSVHGDRPAPMRAALADSSTTLSFGVGGSRP